MSHLLRYTTDSMNGQGGWVMGGNLAGMELVALW